jgi:hypothetical protein
MPKRIIGERLTRQGETDAFDRAFWRLAGDEAKWAAMAQMVYEAELLRGRDARESRLQRTVECLKRREG